MEALAIAGNLLGWALLLLAGVGAVYMAVAARVFARFMGARIAAPPRRDPVTLLKPLHGAEPRLAENLASFLDQDHQGPVQLLCGVQRADDPAVAAVRALQARHPQARIDLVIDPTPHGSSGKVANLINLTAHIAHETVVLSDSDMVAGRDYLSRVLAALDAPGVGAVTCLYHGRGDAGFWSRLGAAGIDWQFLVGATFGTSLGLAKPCMGSTIALRRETLDAIGGFTRFADVLADDYAIGAAVRGQGLEVAVPPMLVTHASAETGLRELWRHELRWGVTVRDVVPGAYLGGVIGMPLPLALLGTIFHPLAGAWLVAAALLARFYAAASVRRQVGKSPLPLWLLPLRDCLTLAVFVASLFARSVDWRGTTLTMESDGRVAAKMKASHT